MRKYKSQVQIICAHHYHQDYSVSTHLGMLAIGGGGGGSIKIPFLRKIMLGTLLFCICLDRVRKLMMAIMDNEVDDGNDVDDGDGTEDDLGSGGG